ncbi:PREDICTED: uncharacterized protein LOC104808546 isoform X2 [Tarenaya hassleriana]|uniref:uncharacterized protein LOC104808546 isoform X2 n=1 Tax=Tarenaya hassleriana TaxID=28532 RepID=UPI00053C2844|nr:PREDICTED: uncharacterized protein LOC104808546 isoform X2 [Tarenaya hassleriana]
MTGGDHSKPPAQKPPSSSAAQSGGGSRKSRWSSSNNNDGVGVGVNIKNSNSTAGQKSAEKRPWRPNPSPKPGPATPSQAPPKHPNSLSDPSPRSGPAPIPPPAPFSFPDPAALGPPPPPSYGFHMLERRSIVLADGSVRSYFALPPDYQDFPPPPRYVDPIGNRFLGPEFGRFPPPISPEGFRDRREHWDRADVSMKRKYPGEEEHDRRNERGELNGQRQQFMQYPNSGASSPFRRSFGEDMRAPKHMRVGSGGYESGGQVPKNLEVDQVALKKLFLHYVKLVYENPAERKKYLEDGKRGRLQCLVCGRSSKDVEDIHGMIMHAYGSDDGNKRVDHLGLHRALCLVMGWDFSKVPDHSKAYQILPTEVAAANRDDLIIWPPHVIVHNTSTGKGKEERMEGYGNKAMDNIIRGLGPGLSGLRDNSSVVYP